MMDISLIKFGTLTLEYAENPTNKFYELGKYFGKLGDSSVIHIEYETDHYLIDTGFANEADFSQKNVLFNETALKHHLKLYNLNFEDISGIFVTHWHTDHFANLRLFPRAKVYCFDPENALNLDAVAKSYHFEQLLPIIPLSATDSFAGCQLLPTPGHTRLHCSLLAPFQNFNIVIAGDAIVSQSYYDHDSAWPYNAGNLGEAACKKAMGKIIEIADYIIPGHGHPFQNYKKV